MTATPDPFDRLHDTLVASARRLETVDTQQRSTRRRWWRTHPLAVAAVALTVTGTATAAVVATTATRDVPMSQQKPISTATLRALTSPDAVELTTTQRRLVQNEMVRDYELLPQNARAVPSPSTRPGHTGSWVIIPGRRGICLEYGSGGGCSPTSAFESGRAFTYSMPAPRITNSEEIQNGTKPTISGAPSDGPGTVKGVVPNEVTSVVALDQAGQPVADAAVRNNVYELRLSQFQAMKRLEIRAGTRTIATVPFD